MMKYKYIKMLAYVATVFFTINTFTILFTACYLLWMISLDVNKFKEQFRLNNGKIRNENINYSDIKIDLMELEVKGADSFVEDNSDVFDSFAGNDFEKMLFLADVSQARKDSVTKEVRQVSYQSQSPQRPSQSVEIFQSIARENSANISSDSEDY